MVMTPDGLKAEIKRQKQLDAENMPKSEEDIKRAEESLRNHTMKNSEGKWSIGILKEIDERIFAIEKRQLSLIEELEKIKREMI